MRKPGNWIAACAVAAGLACLLWPAPEGLAEARMLRTAGMVIAALGLWATHALPEHVTSLGFMTLVVLLGIAPPAVAFSGFAGGAVWLLFGGIIIGLAVEDTGLGKRIAEFALARISLSYASGVVALVTVSLLLAFVMPASIGRIVILMPIALALADAMGFGPGRPGRTGFALAVGLASFLPAFSILPANLPNVVLFGAAESIYGLTTTYADYLVWHFPAMGFVRSILLVAVILVLFPDTADAAPAPRRREAMAARQKHLLAVLLITLGLWASDFLHHISPAWIALAAAIVILIPATGLAPKTALADKTNMRPFFYVAGILGMGAIIADSGLGGLVAEFLIGLLPLKPGAPAQNYAALTVLSAVFGMAATIPGAPTILVPLAQDLADASGLPLITVLMTQISGLSLMLLPYQSPPLVVAIALGGVRVGDAIRVILAMTALGLLVLAPLNFLWWQLLGLFG